MFMESIEKFSKEVCEKLNYYVYKLIDPRNGEVFYVGKGKDNRVFDHVQGRNLADIENPKIERIKQIHAANLDVIKVIVRYGLTEKEAFIVESVLIDTYPGLTNIQAGHNSDYGPDNVIHIEKTLCAVPAKIQHNMLILKTNEDWYQDNINIINSGKNIGTWRLDIEKAKKYEYVAIVVDRIFRSIYKVDENSWYQQDNRCGFSGEKLKNEISALYIDKSLPEELCVRSSNPVRYFNI